MYKIYSRKRINIFKNQKANKLLKSKKSKKIVTIVIILIIIIQTIRSILNYINPIYEKLSLEEAKSMATLVANQQSTIVMEKYSYEDMFTIEKDNEGNITMVKTNIYQINYIISEIAELTERELNESKHNQIKIPLGSLCGMDIFSGSGPIVNMNIVLLGNVDAELKSEFIAQGINQTLHRVYLQVDCNIKILSSYKNMEEKISNQVLLIENVIVGKIPSSYYNLEGLKEYDDSLNFIY